MIKQLYEAVEGLTMYECKTCGKIFAIRKNQVLKCPFCGEYEIEK